MKIDIQFDDGDNLTSIKSLSDWFIRENIIPNIGEHLFTNENEKDQDDNSGSCEWVVTRKFFDQYNNEVIVRFEDVLNIKP